MKHSINKKIRWTVAVLLFVLCMAAAQALAGDATSVEVDGVYLDAGNPYWKNDGSSGSATDYNAFFDTSTSPPTLRLKDAVIDGNEEWAIFANDDIIIELTGNNYITYNGSDEDTCALYSLGRLIVNGTGSLTINHTNTNSSGISYIMLAAFMKDITIQSGTIAVTMNTAHDVIGINGGNLSISGGQITMDITSNQDVSGVYLSGTFNMTGGSIVITSSNQDVFSHVLKFDSALITGGYGEFWGITGIGLYWSDPDTGTFRITGGHMIFSGDTVALYFPTSETVVPDTTLAILVSTNTDGSGKVEWNASMGPLNNGNFKYVEYVRRSSQPQTGDTSRPWLWLCIGLAALSCAGAALILRRRRA